MGFDNPVDITGSPLSGQPNQVYGVTGQTLVSGAGPTNVHSLQATVNQPNVAGNLAYDLAAIITSGGGSTFPFVRFLIQFFDVGGNFAIWEEDWIVPMSAAGTLKIRGSGSIRGTLMQVQASNLDSVNCTLTNFDLFVSSRLQHTSDWRTNPQQQVPGFAIPTAGTGFDNCLGAVNNFTVLHSSTATFMLGLFAGAVYIRAVASGAADNTKVSFVVRAEEDTSTFNTLLNQASGAGLEISRSMIFPRAVCALDVVNNDGANSAQVFFIATAQPIA